MLHVHTVCIVYATSYCGSMLYYPYMYMYMQVYHSIARAPALTVVQPYSNDFVHSSDHLPRALQQIAKEGKRPVILSVVQPYNNDFVHSSDHLPRPLQGLFKSAYLESDFSQLVILAESHLQEVVTP